MNPHYFWFCGCVLVYDCFNRVVVLRCAWHQSELPHEPYGLEFMQ